MAAAFQIACAGSMIATAHAGDEDGRRIALPALPVNPLACIQSRVSAAPPSSQLS